MISLEYFDYPTNSEIMYFPNSYKKVETLLLLFSLWLLPTIACGIGTNAPTTPETQAIELVNQCDELTNGRSRECNLSVVVKSIDQTFNIDLIAQTTDGIFFKEYPHGELSADRRTMVINLSLKPNEERQLILPYEVDENTQLSGEYVVIVDAVESQGSVLFSSRTKAFVWVQEGQTPELLPTQQEFDSYFSSDFHYTYSKAESSTNDKLSVLIQLQDVPEPLKGQLFVKVVSNEDGYNSTIEVQVTGGILFEGNSLVKADNSQHIATTTTGIIHAKGSRILVFPFHVDSESADGIYTLTIMSKDETGVVRVDESSLSIKKLSSTAKDFTWLSINYLDLIPPPTPFPTWDLSGIAEEAAEISQGIIREGAEIALEQIEEANKPVLTTKVNANLREGPGINHSIIMTVKANEQVRAIGVVNPLNINERWYQVEINNGTIGWLHNMTVNPVDDAALLKLPVLQP